jgi:hypothetical protein
LVTTVQEEARTMTKHAEVEARADVCVERIGRADLAWADPDRHRRARDRYGASGHGPRPSPAACRLIVATVVHHEDLDTEPARLLRLAVRLGSAIEQLDETVQLIWVTGTASVDLLDG